MVSAVPMAFPGTKHERPPPNISECILFCCLRTNTLNACSVTRWWCLCELREFKQIVSRGSKYNFLNLSSVSSDVRGIPLLFVAHKLLLSLVLYSGETEKMQFKKKKFRLMFPVTDVYKPKGRGFILEPLDLAPVFSFFEPGEVCKHRICKGTEEPACPRWELKIRIHYTSAYIPYVYITAVQRSWCGAPVCTSGLSLLLQRLTSVAYKLVLVWIAAVLEHRNWSGFSRGGREVHCDLPSQLQQCGNAMYARYFPVCFLYEEKSMHSLMTTSREWASVWTLVIV